MIRGLMDWLRRKFRRRRREERIAQFSEELGPYEDCVAVPYDWSNTEIGRNPFGIAHIYEELGPCKKEDNAAFSTDWSNTDECYTPLMQSGSGPTAPELPPGNCQGESREIDVCHTPAMQSATGKTAPELHPRNFQGESWEIEHPLQSSARQRPFRSNIKWNKEESSGLCFGGNGNGNVKAIVHLSESDTPTSTEDNVTGRNQSDDAEFSEEVDPCITQGGREANGAAASTDLSNAGVCHTPVIQSAREPTAPELEESSGLIIGGNGNGNAVARLSDSDTLMSTEDNVTEEFSGLSIGCKGNGGVKAVAYLSDSDTLMTTEEELTEHVNEEEEKTEYLRQLLSDEGQKIGYQHPPNSLISHQHGTSFDTVAHDDAVENSSRIIVEDQQSPGGGKRDDLPNEEKSFSKFGSEDDERVDHKEFSARGGDSVSNGGNTAPRGGSHNNGGGSDNAPNREYRLPKEANPGNGRGGDNMLNRGDAAQQSANQGNGRGGDNMLNRGDAAQQGASQDDGRSNNVMSNREDAAHQGAYQGNGRGGDNVLERGKGALKAVEIQVSLENCSHLIAKVSYNDRDDFSVELDKKDIIPLMSVLLEVYELEHIWSSCHGGFDPPMNFLFHLDAQNCTLGEFENYVQKEMRKKKEPDPTQDRSNQPNEHVDLMKLLGNYKQCSEKRLRDLGGIALYDISKLIRAKRYPRKRPLWKRLASHAGLDKSSIDALDIPASDDKDSLAMAFLDFINCTYPREKVARLAAGLVKIGRKDLLTNQNFGIFKRCISSGCIGEREA